MTAVRVVKFKGARYEPPPIQNCHVHSISPLPIRPRSFDVLGLTGLRCGRLTVIGIAIPRRTGNPNNKGARYVVRCDCGAYEHRSAKALRNPKCAQEERCQVCHRVRLLQWHHENKKR